jgi:hypothetical protein
MAGALASSYSRSHGRGLRSLAERRGWTSDEVVAIYEPEPGGWTARVRWVQIAGHTYYRFHIAVIDPNGHAAYTCFATSRADFPELLAPATSKTPESGMSMTARSKARKL